MSSAKLKVCTVNVIFDKVNLILSKRTYPQIIVICLLLIALILKIGILFGDEISVSIFLLIPVAISTWYGGRRAGIFFSIFSTLLWLPIETLFFDHHYINPSSPCWNALIRMCFFLITVEIFSYLKIHSGIEKLQARTDDLTRLLNARGFAEHAEKLFGVAARHNRYISLIYIDLDNFRKMNMQFGRPVGDKLLQVVGGKIASSLRASDVAGRMDSDEFAIVLPETDESGARAMVDTFRLTLLQEMEKNHWPVSFSMGVVTFNSPRANLDDAIKIADSLMHRAKENGKDNIVFGTCPVK